MLKTVSLTWLVIALLIAPLRALAAPDPGGCPMSDSAQPVAGQHHHALADTTDADPGHCPRCAQPGCEDGACHDSGCCSLHLNLGLTGGTPVLRVQAPDVFLTMPREKQSSLPPSPPYRPPV